MQLDKPRDYVVYGFSGGQRSTLPERPPGTPANRGHGGEQETGWIMVMRPDLVHIERAPSQSGKNWNRRGALPPGGFNALSFYANQPEHYQGDGSTATKAMGEFDMNNWVNQIVAVIRWVKADNVTQGLQDEFQEHAKHPLETKQPLGKAKQ
jgi:creatinine amidohydrolase